VKFNSSSRKPTFSVFDIRPLTGEGLGAQAVDPNYITAFYLDCIAQHLVRTKGMLPKTMGPGAAARGTLSSGGVGGSVGGWEGASSAHGAGSAHALADHALTIMMQMLPPGSEAAEAGGCNAEELLHAIAASGGPFAHVSLQEVMALLDRLNAQGQIYSPIDEQRFVPVNSA
jgi:hypothetical protein